MFGYQMKYEIRIMVHEIMNTFASKFFGYGFLIYLFLLPLWEKDTMWLNHIFHEDRQL